MNTIYNDLKNLTNSTFSFEPDLQVNIKKKIETIVSHCNNHYDDLGFFGNAALNRKILLDELVANNLTSDVVQYIMTHSNDTSQYVRRIKADGSTIEISLKDILLFGFQEGVPTIKYLLNNDPIYDKKAFEKQMADFEGNTRRIISAIHGAAKRVDEYILPELSTPQEKQLSRITQFIDLYKSKGDSDKLLYAPAYTAQEIREQVDYGFNTVLKCLNITQLKDQPIPATLDSFCQNFLNSDSALLNGDVSHLFYDRLHLTAALESEKKIHFSDGVYTYRSIIETMIRKVESSPEKYPIATTQLSLRLQLIETKFKNLRAQEIYQEQRRPSNGNNLDDSGKYRLMRGPIPKSIFTVQLERIAIQLIRALNTNTPIEIQKIGDEVFLIMDTAEDKSIYNLRDIIKNANLDHLTLDQEYFDEYTVYMNKNPDLTDQPFKSMDEFNKHISTSEHKQAYKKLSLAEAQAINYYTKGDGDSPRFEGYKHLNTLARNPSALPTADIATGLVHAVTLASAMQTLGRWQPKAKNATMVERYFQAYGQDFQSAASKQGVEFLSGFVSSTLDTSAKKKEEKFALAEWMKSKMSISNIGVGYPIADLSSAKEENELLMPPTQVQVTKHKAYDSGQTAFEEEIEVRIVSDLASYPKRSLQMYRTESDLKNLNYAPIYVLIKATQSNDPGLKKAATTLIDVYQVLIEQEWLDDKNRIIFEKIVDNFSQYNSGKIETKELYHRINEHLKTMINEDNLEIAVKCFLKNPEISDLMPNSIFDELDMQNLISKDAAATFSFMEAVKKGDIAAIQSIGNMTGDKQPNKDTVNEALLEAMKYNKWDIVSAICSIKNDNILSQVTLIGVLKRAIVEKQWDLIPTLCDKTKPSTYKKEILLQALKDASTNGPLQAIKAILDTRNSLSSLTLGKEELDELFSNAVQAKRYETVEYYLNHPAFMNVKDSMLIKAIDQVANVDSIHKKPGLFHFLFKESNIPLTKVIIFTALIKAISADNKEVVNFICTESQLKSHQHMPTDIYNALDTILNESLKDENKLDTLRYVCKQDQSFFDKENLLSSLEMAVTKGNKEIIYFICGESLIHLSLTEAQRVLNFAINQQNTDITKYLLTFICNNQDVQLGAKDISTIISSAFEDLLRSQNSKHQELVRMICDEGKVPLSQENINSAFCMALQTSKWDLIQYMNNKYSPTLDQTAISNVLDFASDKGKIDVIEYLCNKHKPQPNESTISSAILKAAQAGHKDLVDFFLTNNNINTSSLSEALKAAIQSKNIEVVKYIYNKINSPEPHMIIEALSTVVENPNLDIINFFLQILIEKYASEFAEIDKTFIDTLVTKAEEKYTKDELMLEDFLGSEDCAGTAIAMIDEVRNNLQESQQILKALKEFVTRLACVKFKSAITQTRDDNLDESRKDTPRSN